MPEFGKAVCAAKAFIQAGIIDDAGHIDPASLEKTIQTLTGRHYLGTDPAALLERSKVDSFYFDALKLSIAAVLDEPEGDLPPAVRTWLASFLRGEVSPPKRSVGRKSEGRVHYQIWQAIQMLVEQGMNATRNDATHHAESACDAVAKALKELGLEPTTFAGVKRVWNQYEKAQREAYTDSE